jgi:hypothetical protein
MRDAFDWSTLCVRYPKETGMDDAPILICYDGSLGPRPARKAAS